jgi:RES domain-containing protein
LILWRISNYADLDGSGGLVVAGRWHSKGQPVLYCAQNPSTALLETLVHLEIDAEDRPAHFQVIRIEGPDKLSRESLDSRKLPAAWPSDLLATQSIGDAWFQARRSLLLEVPSALVPETWNVIVNPLHREASRLRITRVYQHPFDTRFFS